MKVPDLRIINSRAANLAYYFKKKASPFNFSPFKSEILGLDYSM